MFCGNFFQRVSVVVFVASYTSINLYMEYNHSLPKHASLVFNAACGSTFMKSTQTPSNDS